MFANNQIASAPKCPYCTSTNTSKRARLTALGYATFHCRKCGRNYNERTGTPYNNLQFPTEIVFLVVLWRLRYKLSLRDLAEMFLERGFEFTHESVREWETRFAPLITAQLRLERKRDWKRKAVSSWHCDETYLKIKGQQFYLYRAIDKLGNLIDCRLSRTRDLEAAKAFFKQALEIVERPPPKVTTDKHASYPKAIKKVLGVRSNTAPISISTIFRSRIIAK